MTELVRLRFVSLIALPKPNKYLLVVIQGGAQYSSRQACQLGPVNPGEL